MNREERFLEQLPKTRVSLRGQFTGPNPRGYTGDLIRVR